MTATALSQPAVQPKALRVLAVVHVAMALGLAHFWYAFFLGDAFPHDELRPLIANFDGYLAWESSFVVPDLILAVGLLFSAFALWTGRGKSEGRLLAGICGGAILFLGVLDVTYGLKTGIYNIPHQFGTDLVMAGASCLVISLLTFALIFRR